MCLAPEVQNHLFHLFVAFSARLCTKYHYESLCTLSLYPLLLIDECSCLQSCLLTAKNWTQHIVMWGAGAEIDGGGVKEAKVQLLAI